MYIMDAFKALGQAISAADFKARCLELVQQVHTSNAEFVVTRHGKPMARLVPVEHAEAATVFGCMAGSAVVTGDLVAPLGGEYGMDRGELAPPSRRRKR